MYIINFLKHCRRHFQIQFLYRRFCNLIQISLRFVSRHLINNKSTTGFHFGSSPNRWKPVDWNNADKMSNTKQHQRCTMRPRPHFNINTIYPMYGDSHVKNKMVTGPSYLEHGNPYTGKTVCLCWDGPQVKITNSLLTLLKYLYRILTVVLIHFNRFLILFYFL